MGRDAGHVVSYTEDVIAATIPVIAGKDKVPFQLHFSGHLGENPGRL